MHWSQLQVRLTCVGTVCACASPGALGTGSKGRQVGVCCEVSSLVGGFPAGLGLQATVDVLGTRAWLTGVSSQRE